MNGMYGMSTAEQLIAINHMQVAANHAVPSGAMPFQEVLRVYGEDQITGVGSCIDYEKRKIKRGSFANVGVVKSICKQVQTAAYQGSNHGISATGGFTSHGYSCRNRVSFVN